MVIKGENRGKSIDERDHREDNSRRPIPISPTSTHLY